jgi:drug/metabolite transporter (DMT)-like permease
MSVLHVVPITEFVAAQQQPPPATNSISTSVVLSVLGSAILHATWNALAHGIKDRLAGFTLIGLAYTGFCALIVMGTGAPAANAWPFILTSAAVHILYQLMLMASYHMGEFSQVYPLARGTSPWVVAIVSITVLDQHLPLWELVGVLVVSAGLISLVFVGGFPASTELPAVAAAVCTGLMIAGYTIIDGVGVHTTSMLTYTGWMFLLQGPAVPLLAWVKRRRGLAAQLRPYLVRGLGGGLVSLAAYGLVLWAQTRGQLAPIAALRETSIIFGSLIGAVFFHERLGRGRAAAALIVLAGIVLINLP